jgi:U3 small nucleolar RNA-associated protein 21
LPSLEKPKPISGVEKKVDESIAERSRIMKMDRLSSEGAFTVSLRAGGESGDCSSLPSPFHALANIDRYPFHHAPQDALAVRRGPRDPLPDAQPRRRDRRAGQLRVCTHQPSEAEERL